MAAEEDPAVSTANANTAWQNDLRVTLEAALPGKVYSDQDPAFQQSRGSYWSLNARETKPACIVRPTSVHDVSAAIKLLKAEFDATKDSSSSSSSPLKFAVRSGGHSPEAGFASVEGGVVIDLSLLNSVSASEDRKSVDIGVGARWRDVSSHLDDLGLAVVGGRDGNVGVGGLVLGGGISYFSPRFGMVCDNIEAYEIVLADGSIIQATSSRHEDLWRALKGGTGNFGIVTRVTAKAFAATPIWAGYLFWTGWQFPQLLKAFADFNQPENFDEYAAGPILSLTYKQSLGVTFAASSVVYTKPEAWPPVFKAFQSFWRLGNTTKIQSLTETTDELAKMSATGSRQFQVTTTVKNDLETFTAFKDIFNEKVKEAKSVKGAMWSLVFQPLSAAVTRKGSPNVLGLETRDADDTLIIVLLGVSYLDSGDDDLVQRVSRAIFAGGEQFAQSKGTADEYRYLNYAASGQDPFKGYGMANKQFLQTTSKKYDPDAFFQKAKQGGFKVDNP